MTLTAICGTHKERSFKLPDWPDGISWSIKEGVFYLNNKGRISIAVPKVLHVTSTDWEFVK